MCEILHTSSSTFQFTHPGRGATRSRGLQDVAGGVSIHAPREGCDSPAWYVSLTLESFNSRTPGGVRPASGVSTASRASFNSRTPGGVRRGVHASRGDMVQVSIHAPREGCDFTDRFDINRWNLFQFTHPGRGATRRGRRAGLQRAVSIHAPREGCDLITDRA